MTASVGGFGSVAPGSRRGCGRGRRCGPLHATTLNDCEARLEAPDEGTTSGVVRSGGGDYTETSKVIEVEEGGHNGLQIAGPVAHATDAHAGERCGKRIRTSPP